MVILDGLTDDVSIVFQKKVKCRMWRICRQVYFSHDIVERASDARCLAFFSHMSETIDKEYSIRYRYSLSKAKNHIRIVNVTYLTNASLHIVETVCLQITSTESTRRKVHATGTYTAVYQSCCHAAVSTANSSIGCKTNNRWRRIAIFLLLCSQMVTRRCVFTEPAEFCSKAGYVSIMTLDVRIWEIFNDPLC